MDLAALKAADAALGSNPDLDLAIEALLQLTSTITVDIQTADARQVILFTGEWTMIKRLAQVPLSGNNPLTPQDQAIIAADLCIDTMMYTTKIDCESDPKWARIQPLIGALVAAGVLSQASADAWTALRTKTVQTWAGLGGGTLQLARDS